MLHLIGKGLSRTQVAAELSRSAKTIDRHQERMTKKRGLSSRTDLVRFAIREGFAEARDAQFSWGECAGRRRGRFDSSSINATLALSPGNRSRSAAFTGRS